MKITIEKIWRRIWRHIFQHRLIVGRFACLAVAATIGLPFAEYGSSLILKLGYTTLANSIQLKILLLSLPVLCVLWQFRTADTREQIQKAKEGVEATRESTSTNSLERCIDMLSSENLRTRCLGLIQLAGIRQQGNFAKEVDNATRQQLPLSQGELQEENLSGLNLKGANLTEAGLEGADLSGAYLRFAKMQRARLFRAILQNADLEEAYLERAEMRGINFLGANLHKTNLVGADLRGADLSRSKSLKTANLTDARYDILLTRFPEGFDPGLAGMKSI